MIRMSAILLMKGKVMTPPVKNIKGLKKRFWQNACFDEVSGGFRISLDSYGLTTPAGHAFIVPTRGLAVKICAEWNAQAQDIAPETMPATRSANSAIDGIAFNRDEVRAMLGDYGRADLLYYRATSPKALIDRQALAWDPILRWAGTRFDTVFQTTQGVMFIDQPEAGVARLRAELCRLNDFQLAGVHDLITISGSLILAIALIERQIDVAQAWQTARIDEVWQAELWGEDEEAVRVSDLRYHAFCRAYDFYCEADLTIND